ncbi:hypothetical protein ACTFIZ_010603 [Dictyostelium cf. discoideum]
MVKLKYFILILNLFYFICLNSQEIKLNQVDYDCIENLLTKLETISYVQNFTTIPGYNFCGTPLTPLGRILCSNRGKILDLNLIGGKNKSFVAQDEFSCFKNIGSLSISNINVSNKFYETMPSNIERLDQNGDDIAIGMLPPTLHYYTLEFRNQSIPTVIKFSWLTNLYQMQIINFFISINQIIFENDLTDVGIHGNYFSIIASKFPNLRNVYSIVEIKLLDGYDQSSLSEIKNCTTASVLDIFSRDLSLIPSVELSQLRSPHLKKLTFDLPLKKVDNIIDLSLIGNSMKTISFKNVGVNFTYDGKFPIILPTNEEFETFEFTNGTINNFNFSIFKNVKHLFIPNNLISAPMDLVFNRAILNKLITLDISNNQFFGTINESFCELDLTISNNNFTGMIPSCFTCFFGLSDINLESRFIGNNFINLNQPSSPSIIIPNILIGDIDYSIFGIPVYSFYIFGDNIGGKWVDEYKIITPDGDRFQVEPLIPNKLILIKSIFSHPPYIHLVYSIMNPNYNFTLSLSMTPPQLEIIDWNSSTTDLVIDGSFFTYNKSIVNISIGNESCLVTNTSFYQIKCILSNSIDQSLEDIISYITIGNLTTQFTLNPGVINTILNCTENYNDCNGNGYCLSDIGKCQCDSTHQGDDCSIPYIECIPIGCNGKGICSTSTGKCQCDSNYQGDSCELPLKECLNDCNNVGQCNNQTGICLCPITPYEWIGNDCSIPLHTISAVSPSDTNGGYASIYGWFGNIHTDQQVFIGNKQCIPIYNRSESEINCESPPGTGLKSVSVIQNSINVTSKDIYQYYSNDKQCPNHCTSTSNGICNTTTGYCNCIGRWSGYDCSLYSNPSGGGNDNGGLPGSNTTIDSNTGNTNITNQQTNYQILITKLIEIDFNGNQINEYLLLNKWSIISNISKTVYTFIQSIQNDQCNITYTIEEINKDRDITFAGINFKLTSGSVKMTVSIENYQYSSNLNTLQLQMKSSVNEIQTNEENDCNDDQIEINSIPNQDNSLNYIAIKKDAKVLNGRFIDRIESDGISTFMQTVLISKSNDSITVGMNLPHCTKKCLLDPDFSVLVSPEFVGECSGDDQKSWFLPVVIVVPVVLVATIFAITFIIYKKRFVEAPFKNKIKMMGVKQ